MIPQSTPILPHTEGFVKTEVMSSASAKTMQLQSQISIKAMYPNAFSAFG